MNLRKVFGLLLIILGLGAIWWGYGLSQSVEGELTEAVRGMSREVMARYAVGAVMVVFGLYFALRKGV